MKRLESVGEQVTFSGCSDTVDVVVTGVAEDGRSAAIFQQSFDT